MRTISYDNTFGMVDLAVYTNLMASDPYLPQTLPHPIAQLLSATHL